MALEVYAWEKSVEKISWKSESFSSKGKNKTPNQEHAPCPYTANFDFKLEQCQTK